MQIYTYAGLSGHARGGDSSRGGGGGGEGWAGDALDAVVWQRQQRKSEASDIGNGKSLTHWFVLDSRNSGAGMNCQITAEARTSEHGGGWLCAEDDRIQNWLNEPQVSFQSIKCMSQRIQRTANLDLQTAVANHPTAQSFHFSFFPGKTSNLSFVWRIHFKRAHVYHDATKRDQKI